MRCVQGQLIVGSFLRLIGECPIVGQVQSVTKDEIVDPAAANCPSCFGRIVVAVHGSLKSLDSSCKISSCVGRKVR